VISPPALAIQEFNTIWVADTTTRKDNAIKELSFVYFMCDPNSPYIAYSDAKRIEKIKSDIIRDPEYKLSERIARAMAKYEELLITSSPTLSMLKSAQRAITKIQDFFDTVEVANDKTGTKMATLIKTLASLDGVVRGLASLEQKVSLETDTSARSRGGGFIGSRELPPSKRGIAK
jgi:hypothetical protein